MALVPETLNSQLKKAFSDSMKEFIRVASSGGNKDSQKEAIEAASKKFGKEVSDAIDAYIKSGDVNVTVTGFTIGPPSPHAITAQPGVGKVS